MSRGYFQPRYNVAPRQSVSVFVLENGRPTMKQMRWGLIPHWSKDMAIGDKMINAKAETIREKPSYNGPFEKRRCLVPANGFFEWQKTPAGKIPFLFKMKGGKPFCFAGIWSTWVKPLAEGEFTFDDQGDVPEPGRVVESFSIITTTPNEMVAKVHDRMPAILFEDHYEWWLDVERHKGEFVHSLLRPFPAEYMECHTVSTLVNSAKNDVPECVKPQS